MKTSELIICIFLLFIFLFVGYQYGLNQNEECYEIIDIKISNFTSGDVIIGSMTIKSNRVGSFKVLGGGKVVRGEE